MDMREVVESFKAVSEVDIKSCPNYVVMKKLNYAMYKKGIPGRKSTVVAAKMSIDVSQSVLDENEEELDQCIDYLATMMENYYKALLDDFGMYSGPLMFIEAAQQFSLELK
jgi:hypothetical protein